MFLSKTFIVLALTFRSLIHFICKWYEYKLFNINFFFFNLLWAVLGLCCWMGFPLVVVRAGHSSCGVSFSLQWLLLLWSMGFSTWAAEVEVHGLWGAGSVVVAHRLSCSMACRIFLDWGLNLCLLHWQVKSLPMSHQGSPEYRLFYTVSCLKCIWSHLIVFLKYWKNT